MLSSAVDRVRDRWVPWFAALEELGENTQIRWGKVGLDGALVETGFLPHKDYDGVGVFAKLLREHEGFTGNLPGSKGRPPPWRRRAEVVSRVMRAPDRPALPWKSLMLRPSSAPPAAFAFTVLSPDETRALLAPRGRAKAALSCRILSALDRAAVPDLVGPGAPHVWLMPVNMRGAVDVRAELRNHISFLPIGFAETAHAMAIQTAMRAAVKSHLHWGTWDAMGVRALLGPRFLRYFTRRLYRGLTEQGGSGWLGSYSYGGVIDAVNGPAKHAWFGIPPVSLMWPIGAAAFAFGGRMSLGLQVHEALGKSAGWAQRAVARWKEVALADAAAA